MYMYLYTLDSLADVVMSVGVVDSGVSISMVLLITYMYTYMYMYMIKINEPQLPRLRTAIYMYHTGLDVKMEVTHMYVYIQVHSVFNTAMYCMSVLFTEWYITDSAPCST